MAGVGFASDTAGFEQVWTLLSSGGAPATSERMSLDGSVGQTAVGDARSSSHGYVLYAGWYPATASEQRTYLPAILRNNP